MTTLSAADYLKFANLQLAAEALYGYDSTVNPSLMPGDPTQPNLPITSANLMA